MPTTAKIFFFLFAIKISSERPVNYDIRFNGGKTDLARTLRTRNNNTNTFSFDISMARALPVFSDREFSSDRNSIEEMQP